ncbi:MAG: ABC transporter permease [Cephaloticoccus sp.]|nr:ABC transporter permease [Cephaloticoccus sp.]MCF7760301.1 ABC transporter permease [Cephaloticoccus sp.]
MSVVPPEAIARVTTSMEGECMVVKFSGSWRVTESRPSWVKTMGQESPKRVRVDVTAVEKWDSSMLLFLFDLQQWCRMMGVYCDLDGLPEKVRAMLGQLSRSHETSMPLDRSQNFFFAVGLATQDIVQKLRDISTFVGECVISINYLLKHPRKFRWRDCLEEMQQCGAMALPIVSLISVLVGLTLAYTGALILRQYGGDIYVADLVGISMVREMGALMTGIVLAGRTGAAFAAQLGNMKANEEIDALETLGISPIDFLVMPRMIALGLMMPLLALYANCLGILGGMMIARSLLEIPPAAYWVEMLTIVDMSDVMSGLIKASTFGIIVGLAGCLRGLQAERSAMGVGLAATSAVVTSILFIIVADAVYAVLFNILGI